MIIGALLILTWLVLLLRYPAKALVISLAAVCGLGLVAAWVAWQDHREATQLARLALRLHYAPDQCPADRALRVEMKNDNDVPLVALRWQVAAYAPGDTINLAENTYDSPRYQGPGQLQPGAAWADCLPLPPVRAGYRVQTLTFRAEQVQGRFAD